jgi:hypothetical protein
LSNYSTDASIISQTSAKIAAELITGGVATLGEFEEIQQRVFNQITAAAGAETLIEILEGSSKSGGSGRSYTPRSSGGGSYTPKTDVAPSDVIVNFGKFRGQTVGSILDQDQEYVEWLAENANHADVKSAAAAVLVAS